MTLTYYYYLFSLYFFFIVFLGAFLEAMKILKAKGIFLSSRLTVSISFKNDTLNVIWKYGVKFWFQKDK